LGVRLKLLVPLVVTHFNLIPPTTIIKELPGREVKILSQDSLDTEHIPSPNNKSLTKGMLKFDFRVNK
jgi:hypothetical protein